MLKELEKVVPPITFETFFKTLKQKGVRENLLVLSTASIMADVIENKYRGLVEKALMKACDYKLDGFIWEE